MIFRHYIPSESESPELFLVRGIKAGFPSQAADYMEQFNLEKELIRNRETTYLSMMEDDTLEEACITGGDLLVIDASLKPGQGNLVAVRYQGEEMVRYFDREGDRIKLMPANKKYKPVSVTDHNELVVVGVVTYTVMNVLDGTFARQRFLFNAETPFELQREIVKNPPATFFADIEGNSMEEACILDGDLLVIDRSLEWSDGRVAVCYIDGTFTLKYIKAAEGYIWLMPANKKVKPIKVTEENSFQVWGVVTYAVRYHYYRK